MDKVRRKSQGHMHQDRKTEGCREPSIHCQVRGECKAHPVNSMWAVCYSDPWCQGSKSYHKAFIKITGPELLLRKVSKPALNREPSKNTTILCFPVCRVTSHRTIVLPNRYLMFISTAPKAVNSNGVLSILQVRAPQWRGQSVPGV